MSSNISRSATSNEVTGDRLVSKPSSDAYKKNWDKIFGKSAKSKSKKECEK